MMKFGPVIQCNLDMNPAQKSVYEAPQNFVELSIVAYFFSSDYDV